MRILRYTQPYSYLHCHHCGTVHRLPDHCPECQQKSLKTLGAGTAKVEEHLQELFPDHDVIRVDRDSTSRVGSWQKFMIAFNKINLRFCSVRKCWQKVTIFRM